jgi:hypothetical protein
MRRGKETSKRRDNTIEFDRRARARIWGLAVDQQDVVSIETGPITFISGAEACKRRRDKSRVVGIDHHNLAVQRVVLVLRTVLAGVSWPGYGGESGIRTRQRT